jgi:hypothetical protein
MIWGTIRTQGLNAIADGADQHEPDPVLGDVELDRHVLVHADNGVETRRRGAEECSVVEAFPTHLAYGANLVAGQLARQRVGHLLVKQDAHGL